MALVGGKIQIRTIYHLRKKMVKWVTCIKYLNGV